MQYFRCVRSSSAPVPVSDRVKLVEWDFMQADNYAVDLINGISAQLSASLTHDENGLFFPTDQTGRIYIPELNFLFLANPNFFTLEVDFGETNMGTPSDNVRFVMFDTGNGFVFGGERGGSTKKWTVYNNAWVNTTGTPNTDLDYFSNKTLVLTHNSNKYLTVNDVYIANTGNLNGGLYIGSSSKSIYNSYVKAVRVYVNGTVPVVLSG